MPNKRAAGLIKIGAWLPDTDLRAIDEAADALHVTRSEWVRLVLRAALVKDGDATAA